MTCKKRFWDNPYLTELDTRITGIDGQTVTVEETICYAFSGGQQSDSGTIAGREILDAQKDGFEIRYTLAGTDGLAVGLPVKMVLDWDKRHRLMKLHFAAELVLEWVYQNCGHPEKIGANITQDKARVDFVWEGNIKEVFPRMQPAIEAMIAADLPIVSAFSDLETETRYWEIDGFARVPCGGTHPRSTGEIGALRFKRTNPGSGKERIEITLIEA